MRWMTLVLVACGGTTIPADPSDPEAPSYAERGPWAVGTEEVDIVGTDGLAITVQIWYPTTDETGVEAVYDGVLPGEAFADAVPDCAEVHPVMAFSHGYGGVRWQSPFFTEFLASHGWMVVAPDHPGNTAFDPSGDAIALMARRPTDIADSVEAVFERHPDCVDPSAGYAVSGHSFGGYTALVAAGAETTLAEPPTPDDRVWAVVAMAPWDGLGALTDGTSAVGVPTLVLTGERDETTPIAMVEGLWEPLVVEPRTFGVFADAGHYSFSPVACDLEDSDGCGDDFLDLDRFTEIVQTAATAFLEDVRGVEGAIEQLPADAPEVVWTEVR